MSENTIKINGKSATLTMQVHRNSPSDRYVVVKHEGNDHEARIIVHEVELIGNGRSFTFDVPMKTDAQIFPSGSRVKVTIEPDEEAPNEVTQEGAVAPAGAETTNIAQGKGE